MRQEFEAQKPDSFDYDLYFEACQRLCKHPEDAEHWREGFRKAGFPV